MRQLKQPLAKNNKLINLGFQNKVLDKSVGNLSDLKRTFSERMEIIRDLEVHTKWVHREGIAVGGEDSEHLLFVDNRPWHKLNSSDVQLLRNGCRIIKSESVHVEHRLDTLPELLMYPETPQEFLSVYLDDKKLFHFRVRLGRELRQIAELHGFGFGNYGLFYGSRLSLPRRIVFQRN